MARHSKSQQTATRRLRPRPFTVGVFDSGLGGITVLRVLRRKFPRCRFVYLGDTAHVPYGTRSRVQIRSLIRQAAKRLFQKKPDAIVVACGTASSVGLDLFKRRGYPAPIGVVEPASAAAIQAIRSPKDSILVLATRATVQSEAYLHALSRQGARHVLQQACPLFVPLVEEGWTDHPVTHAIVHEYVGPFRDRSGVVVLGCTHYPWLLNPLQKALPRWRFVDSAEAVAQELATQLSSWNAQQPGVQVRPPRTPLKAATVEWIFTDPATHESTFFTRISCDRDKGA